jgi:DNA relaxase NicK
LGEREWKSLFLWAKKKAGRLSQIDIAADDKSGDFFDVFQIREDHKRNPRNFLSLAGFDRGGKLPKISWQDSGVDGCEGATFYHGSPSAALRTRVYEKGKQLADTLEGIENPNWVRWEQIFRKTNKSFLDIGLMRPSAWRSALLGSSKYFSDKFSATGSHFTFSNINPVHEPIETAARAINALRSQWGGVLAEVVRIVGVEAALDLLHGTSKNPIFTDLTHYHADMLCDKVEELRAKGSACGKGSQLFRVDETFDW